MDEPTFDLDGVFDDAYPRLLSGVIGEAASDADVEAMTGWLALRPGDRVADLPCGHGRIANRLAAHGLEVAGLDRSGHYLELAREDAAARGVRVDYRQGDLRALPWPAATFDVLVCWFSSFGYFDDDRENQRVLEEFARVLVAGGRLLLEQVNPTMLLRGLRGDPPVKVFNQQVGEDVLVDTIWWQLERGRMVTERVAVVDGETRESRFAIRLLTAPELTAWLSAAGFSGVELWDETGGPLTLDSRRMVAVARR